MMIGVAQVMGINPIFRSRFSGAPLACAKASRAPASGNTLSSAANSVPAPSVLISARRVAACGKAARNTAS